MNYFPTYTVSSRHRSLLQLLLPSTSSVPLLSIPQESVPKEFIAAPIMELLTSSFTKALHSLQSTQMATLSVF